MDSNLIKGFYTGCVKSNNIGDDILFFVFLHLLKNTIESKFNSLCQIKEVPELGVVEGKGWINQSGIGVIGGGSLIHPGEMSYTIPVLNINDFENRSLVFGTGVSDSPDYQIPYNNRQKILSYDFSDIGFPMNPLMVKNSEIIKKIKNGGLRGPIDSRILGIDGEKYIYDPGLIAGKMIPFNKEIKRSNTIGINLCHVTGDNRISKPGEDFISYTRRIFSEIVDLCRILLDSGYNINFYSMAKGEEKIHEKLLESTDLIKKYGDKITIHNYLDFSSLLSLLSGFKISLALRLHGNILANSVETPSINLMYNFKALNYMESTNQRCLGIPTDQNLTSANLIERINYIEKNYKGLLKNLREHTKNAKKLHSESLEAVLKNVGILSEYSYQLEHNNTHSLYSIFQIKTKK